MSDNAYLCECCGGTVDPVTLKCDYCGTKYKRDLNNTIRVETFINPVRTFSATTALDVDGIRTLGVEQASEFAMKHLARQLAEAIPQNMLVESELDPVHHCYNVRGMIKLVEPVNKSTRVIPSSPFFD